MQYKLINTANTDQQLPVMHGKKANGVVGSSKNLPQKIVIPGIAKSGEGQNCTIVSEEVLRSIFGLYENIKPGVLDPSKPCRISPDNVKSNTRILDSGRIIVVDEKGNHLFGIGGQAYQKNALDSLKSENEMYKDKFLTLIKSLVDDGYTEDQAEAIVSGNASKLQEVLKKKDSKVTGKGHDLGEAPVEEPVEEQAIEGEPTAKKAPKKNK